MICKLLFGISVRLEDVAVTERSSALSSLSSTVKVDVPDFPGRMVKLAGVVTVGGVLTGGGGAELSPGTVTVSVLLDVVFPLLTETVRVAVPVAVGEASTTSVFVAPAPETKILDCGTIVALDEVTLTESLSTDVVESPIVN